MVCLRKSAESARDIGFRLCRLIEYSYVIILSQMAQMVAEERQVGEMNQPENESTTPLYCIKRKAG